MTLLPGLLFILLGDAARCRLQDGSFTFNGDVHHYAVATNTVYVATNDTLYQLRHDLTLVQSVPQRGVLKGGAQVQFHRVSGTDFSNATFRINVLLPLVESDTLISCGVIDKECGHCEVLKLMDISSLQHSESIQVGSLDHSNASVAVLVKVEKNTYILTALRQSQNQKERTSCTTTLVTVQLQNAEKNQEGGIFSLVDLYGGNPLIESSGEVEFVDGFQISSTMYLLSNVRSGDKSNRIRLIWLKGGGSKTLTLKSLRGATLRVSEAGGHRLVASSVIPGEQQVLWSGVFSADVGRTNTELLVFDISPDFSGEQKPDPDFGSKIRDTSAPEPKTLKPKAVLFRQSNMTSVLAVRHKTWVVFFIGTGDGQLIKLAVDKDYHTSCPMVLYRADDDRQVFPKIQLDPVDRNYVYMPVRNQMKRVPVSNCSMYRDVKECWSAQDPHCVWCGSKDSCTFEADCVDSDWLSIPEDYQEKMVSHRVAKEPTGQITLNVQTHLTAGQMAQSNFACQFSAGSIALQCTSGPAPMFPQCTCILPNGPLPAEVFVNMSLGKTQLLERLTLTNCSDIRGPPTSVLCRQCFEAGCSWSKNKCSWENEGVRNDSVCKRMVSGIKFSTPEISSIDPGVVSFYGRNHAVLYGRNLSDVTRVRLQARTECKPQESPVWNNTGTSLTFHIPSAESKGVVKVCALLPDGSCHGSSTITYQSSPSCSNIVPNSTWLSGKRKLTIIGSHLDFVEGVTQSHAPQEVRLPQNRTYQNLTYETVAAVNAQGPFPSTVFLKVGNETLPCTPTITVYPEPKFISFKSIIVGDYLRITIEKKADKLEMMKTELSVSAVLGEERFNCTMTTKESHNETDTFACEIQNTRVAEFQHLMIKYGDKTVKLQRKSSFPFIWLLLFLLPIPCIIITVVMVYRSKQKKLTAKMNSDMENLELDIRNDIRQGFVDLQTEQIGLIENVGAIPFLDYNHFASRIFFPERGTLMKLCIKDIGQDAGKVQLDECCLVLSQLIHNRLFLTSMVHALEEQKSFTIKNKCALASLLTVALHGDLLYLTEVMEVLLKDLMQQNSNTHSKLLLRGTESTVEKLLTNWMSICLYGFLRESVGQHLFLMVSALTQQIKKGPVDYVTEKALYTLSEDWLLWQAQDFSSLKLKVLFAVGSDGELSEPLEVNSLSCDTVEQVKEKILSTFKSKFGFPFNIPLSEVRIEYERDGCFVPLEEVDGSSEVVGEVTMLNTLKHYKVPDGATIKVLQRKSHPQQGSVKDDENFSRKYFHLIDPDVDEDQRKDPERKKLKLKEVHLTKLLSTKVAVHSFVENLFKSIWGLTQGRAPHAIKYFFDFLDAQAADMKITDPDVLHIWKTNSLPLRFWINILKNPQFVFDMEKTPQLEGCLSVIAQAFMDSFSLTESQLGKHTPTNKLLYAKDIPRFKQEVRAYYKQIREQSEITESEFKSFLQEESKKHHNEFDETAALRELYKFIQSYFTEIKDKLNENGAPTELTEQLHHLKTQFDGLKSCSWS
ncbi:plexin-C1 [Pleuronectes platessa]|uniref:plexin-C1 n=1 Tax=Pleuronectes platessa TaxID=8262 RepID=UPI00232A1A61|nr:plexin-C1 [Pleuronectes platessa]